MNIPALLRCAGALLSRFPRILTLLPECPAGAGGFHPYRYGSVLISLDVGGDCGGALLESTGMPLLGAEWWLILRFFLVMRAGVACGGLDAPRRGSGVGYSGVKMARSCSGVRFLGLKVPRWGLDVGLLGVKVVGRRSFGASTGLYGVHLRSVGALTGVKGLQPRAVGVITGV